MTPAPSGVPLIASPGSWLRFLAGTWLAKSAVIAAVIGVQFFGPMALVATYLSLSCWALLGPRRAIQALSLAWLPSLLNPELFHFGFRLIWYGSQSYVLLKWLVLLASGAVCLWRVIVDRRPVPMSVTWVSLFVAVAAIASAVTSFMPDVSLTKLASFWLGATTVLLAYQLTAHELEQHEVWFLALARTLVFISLPLLLVPGMYHHHHENLFQGLFFQPQNGGVVFAVIAAWLGGRCLAAARLPIVDAAAAAGALVLLWETGSRTAAFALLGSLIVASALDLAARRPSAAAIAGYLFRPRFAIAGVLVLVAITAYGGRLADGISAFVQKRPEGTIRGTNWELLASREQLIREQWENFQKSPVFGNGFGVPSVADRAWVLRDDSTGIAVSSVTEKGFLVTAVLEETGIVGAAILSMLLSSLARTLYRLRSFPKTWLAITAFTVNFGESAFFSFGGFGMFLWVMIGLATAGTPPPRTKREVAAWSPPMSGSSVDLRA
jgi:hypothetical protein